MGYKYRCPICHRSFFSMERMNWVTCICCGKNWEVKKAGKGSRIYQLKGGSNTALDTCTLVLVLFFRLVSPGALIFFGIFLHMPLLIAVAAAIPLMWWMLLAERGH